MTTSVSLMLTRRCDMACRHCSVASSPSLKDQVTQEDLLAVVREAAAAGVNSINLTGGEPMLLPSVVRAVVAECRRLGVTTRMTTNGSWAVSPEATRAELERLFAAGLGGVAVSHDRYHAEFQGEGPALLIARETDRLGMPVQINLVREADDRELAALVAPFEIFPKAALRFYDVQPVGRARSLPAANLRAEVDGYCNACDAAAITDDGRVVACNGPSYFSRPSSPLVLGSYRETPLAELLRRHAEDPILETIRTGGPARLRDELRTLLPAFPFRDRYSGMCDLCVHITSNPEAVAALRGRLDDSRLTAERLAARQLIERDRRAGFGKRGEVNSVVAARMFLGAARNPQAPFSARDQPVLGRADIDWAHIAAYLAICGLARALLPALAAPELRRYAPTFFSERLRTAALRDGLRESVQREVLAQVDAALCEIGEKGVLLKGMALLALDLAPLRSASDIDVVAGSAARALRERLLARGFAPAPGDPATAPHHLPPVSWRGVPVEIRARIMPRFWGLPEADMLASAQPAPRFAALLVPAPEAIVLHAAVHASAHLFASGLKTGWDLALLFDRYPGLDWERLAELVARTRLRRAFWTPFNVLCRELALPIPADFLRRAPGDARQRRLELIARHRLFTSIEGPFDLNPWTKTAIFLLLHDSPFGAIGYVADILRKESRAARATGIAKAPESLRVQLRRAVGDYRGYRRALARARRP